MTETTEKEEFVSVVIKRNDDGTITGGHGKYEHFAVLLSEGFGIGEAWEGAGYTNTRGSMRMRAKVMRNPVFQNRLEYLRIEREQNAPLIAAQNVSPEHATFKEVRWMALQTYRRAVAKDDIKVMVEMTNLMMKLGIDQKARLAAAAPPPPAAEPVVDEDRGPGRPPAAPPEDNPADQIRARLAEKGLNLPGKAA